MQKEIAGALKSFSTSGVFSNDFIAGRSHQSHSPLPSRPLPSALLLHSRSTASTLRAIEAADRGARDERSPHRPALPPARQRLALRHHAQEIRAADLLDVCRGVAAAQELG